MKMIKTVKKILKDNRYRVIAICILCACILAFSVWFLAERITSVNEAKNPNNLVDTDGSKVSLGNKVTTISTGDTVVINVYADEMDAVYGYQFDLNYDREFLEYKKRLYSDIDEILTIFATDKEWYLLVGATMIGDMKGYSGQEVPVCRLEFVALAEFDLGDSFASDHITLARVNVVKDDLHYVENIGGWTTSITVL